MPFTLGSLGGLLIILSAVFYARRAMSHHRHSDALVFASAGVAISYTFLDVFPHLARYQIFFDSLGTGTVLLYLSHHLYLLALLGFCMQVIAQVVQSGEAGTGKGHVTHWVMCLLLCIYSALLGYMLADQPAHRPEPALLFGLAMGAHMLGLADELLDYNPELYDARLRFLLMASVTLGWIWGNVDDLSRTAYALIFAFIAGSVVASGTQSALPRISSATALPAFITGAFLYSIMLLMIEHFAD